MAVSSSQTAAPFRLSMLLYDRRFRSTTIQVVALLALLIALSWLVGNAVENLEKLGKTFDFGFLWTTSNYNIEPQLIAYSSTSTHFRAAVVGLLNTLAVAIPGWFLATFIGVIIGVLRLSKSWITARLMTVYIEVLRNVPVVIWLIVLYGIVTLITPQPSEFRGENPTASMILGSFAITNRGTYLPAPVFGDGSLLVAATFVLSIVGMFFFSRWSKRRQEATGKILPNFWILLGILIVPAFLMDLVMGKAVSLEFPALTGFNFKGGLQLPNSYLALLIGLSVYTSSYIAENVRAGVQAISRGQTEAAYSLGLRPGRTMNLVILPQALRIIVPPLISQWLNLTKNTSLGIFVTYTELKATLGGITMNQTGRELECNFLMMGIYLTISLLISALLNLYNRAVRLKER